MYDDTRHGESLISKNYQKDNANLMTNLNSWHFSSFCFSSQYSAFVGHLLDLQLKSSSESHHLLLMPLSQPQIGTHHLHPLDRLHFLLQTTFLVSSPLTHLSFSSFFLQILPSFSSPLPPSLPSQLQLQRAPQLSPFQAIHLFFIILSNGPALPPIPI